MRLWPKKRKGFFRTLTPLDLGGLPVPQTIEGLVLWFDADDISASDGDAVSSWVDKTGVYTATSSGTARPLYRPTDGVQGRAALQFDGSNDRMSITPAKTDWSAMTIFVLYDKREQNGDRVLFSVTNNTVSNKHSWLLDDITVDKPGLNVNQSAGGNRVSTTNVSPESVTRLTATANGTNDWRIRINGVEETLVVLAGSEGLWQQSDANTMTIGAGELSSGFRDFFRGRISQIIGYDRVLTAAEITRVENYLNGTIPNGELIALWDTAKSGTHDWVGRPFLLDDINGSGRWAMLYRSGTAHAVTGGEIHIRFSEDDGDTWTAENTKVGGGAVTGFPLTPHAPATGISEACMIRADDGSVHIHTLEQDAGHRGGYHYSSADSGESWTDNGKIASDAELFGQDMTKEVSTGDLWSSYQEDATGRKSGTFRSQDDGATWSDLGHMTGASDDATSEVGIVHIASNTIIAVCREQGANTKTYKYVSTDDGVTWGSQTNITAQVGVVHKPLIVLDGSTIYMFGREVVTAGAEEYASVWKSTDNGVTWSKLRVSGKYPDCGYSHAAKRSDGLWYFVTYLGIQADSDKAELVAYKVSF